LYALRTWPWMNKFHSSRAANCSLLHAGQVEKVDCRFLKIHAISIKYTPENLTYSCDQLLSQKCTNKSLWQAMKNGEVCWVDRHLCDLLTLCWINHVDESALYFLRTLYFKIL